MLKLCHYLIFYKNVQCEEVIQETFSNKQRVKGKASIICVFCKQIKTQHFIRYYHKFDQVERFGKLIRLEHSIYCHEMCLLWSNLAVVDFKSNRVDPSSLLRAIEQSHTQKCDYCQNYGASLKCNHGECQLWYHFYCLK